MQTFEIAAHDVTNVDEKSEVARGAPLARLLERAQKFRAGPRSPIADLGRGFVYIVAKGVAALQSTTGENTHTVTELLYAGDILVPELQPPLPGLMLLANRPVEFSKLTISALADASMRDSRLWQAVFQRLNAQNARAQLHIATTSSLTCEQRIAGFLIEIGSRLGAANRGALSFDLPLSRYSMADYLSLNADTVSRTLSGLVTRRIIERRGRSQIIVRDWAALFDMCPLGGAIAAVHGTKSQ